MPAKPTATSALVELGPGITLAGELGTGFAHFTEDGRRAVYRTTDTVQVLEVGTGAVQAEVVPRREGASTIRLSPDGERLATWDYGFAAVLFDVRTGRELGAVEKHQSQFGRIAWAQDGSRVALLDYDFNAGLPIRVLSRDGKRLPDIPLEEGAKAMVPWGPCGVALLLDESPARVVSVDLKTGKVGRPRTIDDGSAGALAVRGERLAVSCRPFHLALGAVEGGPGKLWPSQAALDKAQAPALKAMVERVTARKKGALSARHKQDVQAQLQAARKLLKDGAPRLSDFASWLPGLGPESSSLPADGGLAFADDETLIVAGPREVVALDARTGAAALVVTTLPKFGLRSWLRLVGAQGGLLAVAYCGPKRDADRTLLLRLPAR